MPRLLTIITLGLCFILGLILAPIIVHAAKPTASAALGLKPVQKDVDLDQPDDDEIEKCELISEKVGTATGWVVYGPNGEILRRFLDTNNDKKVDRWCYYKNGIEVYRDIDADYNGKADQYRWMGTAGIRWGLDENEDGKLDRWKAISPEEVTEEIVAALRDRDAERFNRLLLTDEELANLGLSEEQAAPIKEKIANASAAFQRIAGEQKIVAADSAWIHFGGRRPGVIASGPDGPARDVVVYDNVTAVVETDGKHSQLLVGSLIKVADGWRAIDLPQNLIDQQAGANNGYFFQASLARTDSAVRGGLSEEVQDLLTKLEEVDADLVKDPTGANAAKLNARRADVLEQLINATVEENRENWIRQYSDSISAAVQTGIYPEGMGRLEKLYDQLRTQAPRDSITGYVKFRVMTANYGLDMQKADVDFAKVQEAWIRDLKDFIADFAETEEAPEAMLQLAIAYEFAGESDSAAKWYGQIADKYSGTPRAEKARGARLRLESIGKTISLRGQTIDGGTADLASYRGKTVLIHYWATWYPNVKEDMAKLKSLVAKYGAGGFTVLGVNVDSRKADAQQFLQANRYPWKQLHEEGGLDGRLANQLGIMTLPAMLLVGEDGKVISREMHLEELEEELEQRLK